MDIHRLIAGPFVLGVVMLGLSGSMFLSLMLGPQNGTSLPMRTRYLSLLKDFHDPTVKFGGPLGIIRSTLKGGLYVTIAGILVFVVASLLTGHVYYKIR